MATNPYQQSQESGKNGCMKAILEEGPSSMVNMSCCPTGLMNTYQVTNEHLHTTDADEQPSQDISNSVSTIASSSRPQISIKCF